MAEVVQTSSVPSGACAALSSLHTVEKALSLPVVEAAVSQASSLYCTVKGAHPLVTWALMTAERTALKAAVTASPFVAPFAAPLAAPLAAADAKLAAGLQALEDRVPIVKERPEVVYAAARQAVARALQPKIAQVNEVRESATRAAVSLRELSWRAANDVLATQTGKIAVEGVDGGAAVAQRLLDYYLPPAATAEDNVQPAADSSESAAMGGRPVYFYLGYLQTPVEIVSASEDPALHTVQTVSRLSISAAERLYIATLNRIRELRETHDPARYVAALITVLHLTRILRPDLIAANQPQNQTNQPDQSQINQPNQSQSNQQNQPQQAVNKNSS